MAETARPAPDSIIAGLSRDVAKAIGVLLVAKGLSAAGTEAFTDVAAQIVAGLLTAAIGVGLSIWQKYRVTRYIVAANQAPALPTDTPPAEVVAQAGQAVANKG